MRADREHVVLFDRTGFRHFRHPDGAPFLPPDRFRVTVLTAPDSAPPPAGAADAVIALPDSDDTEAAASALLGQPPVDRVAAVSEPLLLPAARLRDRLGVPGFRAAQVVVLRDKLAMKRHFAARGIKVPEYRVVRRPLEAAGLLAAHGTIVVKPPSGTGRAGVVVVSSRAELAELEEAGYGQGPGFGADGFLAEAYVHGDEFHIDSVVSAGRAVTTTVSRYLDPHFGLQLGGRLGAATLDPGPRRDLLREFNDQVLAAIGWFSGVTHLEAWLPHGGEPVLCEIAGRAGGAGIIPGFWYRYAASLHLHALLPQLGLPHPALRETAMPAGPATGWAIIYPPAAGTVISCDTDLNEPWLTDLTWLVRPGDQVTEPTRSTRQGIAVVSVAGPGKSAIAARLARAHRHVTVTVAPAPAARAGREVSHQHHL
ncbi:MAG TPA: hypothetical protein VGG25_20165 [Streptosporangiaceae bacterium]